MVVTPWNSCCPRVFMPFFRQAKPSERLCYSLHAKRVKPCACRCSLSFVYPSAATIPVEPSCPCCRRAKESNTYGEKCATRFDRCQPFQRRLFGAAIAADSCIEDNTSASSSVFVGLRVDCETDDVANEIFFCGCLAGAPWDAGSLLFRASAASRCGPE